MPNTSDRTSQTIDIDSLRRAISENFWRDSPTYGWPRVSDSFTYDTPPPPPPSPLGGLRIRIGSLGDVSRPRPVRMRTCMHCRASKPQTDFESTYQYCKDCYASHYNACSSCGTVFKKEDVYSFKGASKCYSCISPVMSYSTDVLSARRWNPTAGSSGRYYGVELEVYGPKGFQRQAVEVLQAVERWGIIKSDSSIQSGSGFEIVSIPGTYQETLNYWMPFLKKIPKGLIGHRGGCGMHVHVSRSALRSNTIRYLSCFLNDTENKEYLEYIANRPLNRYCKQNPFMTFTSPEAYQARDRYTIFNTTKSNTVEFRMFRSTVRPKLFQKNLEFVSAVIDYCSTLTATDSLRYSSFIDYLASQNQLDPTKYALINEASKSFRSKDNPF